MVKSRFDFCQVEVSLKIEAKSILTKIDWSIISKLKLRLSFTIAEILTKLDLIKKYILIKSLALPSKLQR